MRSVVLNLPTFGFIVATRAALGAGIALLASRQLTADRRRIAGAALVTAGAIATVPALFALRRGMRRQPANGVSRDARLIGAVRFPRKGDDDSW